MATRPPLKTFPVVDPDYLARMRLATDEAKEIKVVLDRYPGGPTQIKAEQAAEADPQDRAAETE